MSIYIMNLLYFDPDLPLFGIINNDAVIQVDPLRKNDQHMCRVQIDGHGTQMPYAEVQAYQCSLGNNERFRQFRNGLL